MGRMQAQIQTVAFQGVDVVPVDVQVMIAPGNLAKSAVYERIKNWLLAQAISIARPFG